MARPMTPYIVKQGDYLAKLAFVNGFDADAVWNDPKNADIKALRPNPNLLAPGDVLYVPQKPEEPLPIQQGTANSYAAKVPTTQVLLALSDHRGPIANEAYVVNGLGAPLEGTTDGDGKVTFDVPVHVRELRLVLTNRQLELPLLVGDLDPIEEASGVRQRLQHLGYRPRDAACAGWTEDLVAEADREAILAFQSDQGLDPTGLFDDATKTALQAAHGS